MASPAFGTDETKIGPVSVAIATIRERKRQAVWFESLSGFGLRLVTSVCRGE